jgi:hypothetical protein
MQEGRSIAEYWFLVSPPVVDPLPGGAGPSITIVSEVDTSMASAQASLQLKITCPGRLSRGGVGGDCGVFCRFSLGRNNA